MPHYSKEDSLFLTIEIKAIKRTRDNALVFFLLLFLICFTVFLFVFSDRWWNMPQLFTLESAIFLGGLFIYPAILFGGLSWLLCIKNQSYVRALQTLNSHDLAIYRTYTTRLAQRYTPVAPYLFRDDDLLFFALFGDKKIPVSQIHRIETKIIHNYRGPDSFRIYFYNKSVKIHQETMRQQGAFDFLQEQLLVKNPYLSISARNH